MSEIPGVFYAFGLMGVTTLGELWVTTLTEACRYFGGNPQRIPREQDSGGGGTEEHENPGTEGARTEELRNRGTEELKNRVPGDAVVPSATGNFRKLLSATDNIFRKFLVVNGTVFSRISRIERGQPRQLHFPEFVMRNFHSIGICF